MRPALLALLACATALAADIVTGQAPTPEHAPDQPLKTKPVAGTAVSVTLVPVENAAVHAVQGDIVDIGEASSLAPSCAVGEASEEAGGPWVLLDDGTGVVRLDLHNYCAQRARWLHAPGWVERGMYVLVLAIVDLTTAHSVPVAYVIKDLTPEPDRLALWWCELVEVRDKTRLDLGASPVAV